MIKEYFKRLRAANKQNRVRELTTRTYLQKLTQLRMRMRDPEWRRYGKLLIAGKAAGIALVIGLVLLAPELLGWQSFAANGEVKATDIVNPINTFWVLIGAFLVFAMQVGFTMLEAGFLSIQGGLLKAYPQERWQSLRHYRPD